MRKKDVLAFLESGPERRAADAHRAPVPARRAGRAQAAPRRACSASRRSRGARGARSAPPAPLATGRRPAALAHAPGDRLAHGAVAADRGDLHDHRRGRHEPDRGRAQGVRLSYLPYQARATIETLLEFPALNATLEDDQPHGPHRRRAPRDRGQSLGEGGLIVPIIRDAQDLSVEGLAKRIKDIARRARTNQLTPDEVSGGTFTITNPGGYGSIMATPVINLPQVGILDTEAVVKRPVVVTDELGNDSIAIRSMTYLCMGWDHRALDGASPRSSSPRCARSWKPGRLARPDGLTDTRPGRRARGGTDSRARRTLEGTGASPEELLVCHLGRVEYREAAALQERLREQVESRVSCPS